MGCHVHGNSSHGSSGHGPRRQAVLEGVIPFPATAHNPNLLATPVQQPAGHGAAVWQTGGDQQRHRLDHRQGAGAVGGAHENPLAPNQLPGHSQRRIAEVVAIDALAAPLTGAQAQVLGPGGGGGIEGFQLREGLNRLGTVLQRPGNRGGGPQHIDHNGRIGPALGGGPHLGHRFRGGEIGDLHGRSHGRVRHSRNH